MSETLYRVNRDKAWIETEEHSLAMLLHSNMLVPVERCVHGKIDRHKTENAEWCPGSPTLSLDDDAMVPSGSRCLHQYTPWLTLSNGSHVTFCVKCGNKEGWDE